MSTRLKVALGLTVFAGVWLFSACGSAAQPPGPPTATAQALRAQALATQIASRLQLTATALGTDYVSEPTSVPNAEGDFFQAFEATQTAVAQEATQAAVAAENASQEAERQALLQAAAQWPAVITDTFDTSGHGWAEGSDSDPLAEIQWVLAQGHYFWQAQANDGFAWWSTPDLADQTDFFLSVDARQVSGPEDAECGLVFRLNSEGDYYLLDTNGRGEFTLYLHSGSEWESLLPWIGLGSLHAGQANRLGVLVQGSQILVLINDQFVAGVGDDRLPQGSAGLMVGLGKAGDQAAWEFDNFVLKSKP